MYCRYEEINYNVVITLSDSIIPTWYGHKAFLAFAFINLLEGFNKHRWPTKHISYFAHRGRLLFYRKKEQLV